jgi:putative drug exporter of the RND superfamily
VAAAGVVLPATFAALGVSPLAFLAQIALIVSFRFVLDTLLVRSLVVPVLACGLGERAWWPWYPRTRAAEQGAVLPD